MITYLNTQIDLIKPQAEASGRAALEYGYDNGLGLLDGLHSPAAWPGQGYRMMALALALVPRYGGAGGVKLTAPALSKR